jgi:hypothetical protein
LLKLASTSRKQGVSTAAHLALEADQVIWTRFAPRGVRTEDLAMS